MKSQCSEFSIVSLIKDALKIPQLFNDNEKRPVVNIEPNLPKSIIADKRRISQILLSLVENAV
jgi:signal transduction histidine kinase